MPGIRQTVGVFASRRPSIRALLRSRTGSFDRAHLVVPSTAVVGESLAATVQAWDEYERLHGEFEGTLSLSTTDGDARDPDDVTFRGVGNGVKRTTVTFETPGVHYLVAERGGERFVSNPVEVHASDPEYRRYWGDIHLHSKFSDGSGSMAKGMAFGRDVMDLDVVAYSDHDTMGFFIPPQLQRWLMYRRNFEAMKDVTRRFHDPGEFVTLFAYEWTRQPNNGGHVNVYFDGVDDAELFDSLSAESNTYEKLWDRLRAFRERTDTDVLTIPHHPAEEMYPFDFSAVDYDDELAPLVEVYSQWGSSERPGREGNDKPLAMGQGEIDEPGHYAQDALELGYRVGLMGGSDYHGPFPGHSIIHADPHLPSLSEVLEDGLRWGHIWRVWNEQSYPGGLTAFYAPELTREAIFGALRSRRVYGTTQPDRIVVHFAVDGVRVGERDSTVRVDAPDTERRVEFEVAGTAPIERVTVVKNVADWAVVKGTTDGDAPLDAYTMDETVTDDAPVTGTQYDGGRGSDADIYYLRARQTDGGMAWAGPVWVEAAE